MSKIKLEVDKAANGTVNLYKNKQIVTSVEIKKDVDLEIGIGSGFTAAAIVSAFTLYQNVSGGKGAAIGTWNRNTPNVQPSTEVSVAASGTSAILVTDTDRTVDEELFFFSVKVTDGTATYLTDPELKVKKAVG